MTGDEVLELVLRGVGAYLIAFGAVLVLFGLIASIAERLRIRRLERDILRYLSRDLAVMQRRRRRVPR